MGYNSWLKDFFAAWENLRRMALLEAALSAKDFLLPV